ncbi:MAG: DegT/DnrJ/EryC1/StrS family aminotransferase [Phycisphaeraceae bacterium]|nr:DegT/DnrJ/EryC1/StrS family aminotransferase [Phycisphaeraceae bacterium]
MSSPGFHMTPDEFRSAGHAMIDFIASYWEGLSDRPVLAQVAPGDVLAKLPEGPPDSPEAWGRIVADVDPVVMPGITHWQSPSFFAFFPANASPPAVLGELLSAGLGVNGMLWATSPAATELEIRMLDWVAQMLDLPPAFHHSRSGGAGGGVIQGTASEGTLVSMLAARRRAMNSGSVGGPLVAYTSTQAHSSIVKAAMIAGLAGHPDDRRQVRLIEVDRAFAMDPRRLEAAIETDRAAGATPFYVCATVGTTSSTAIDSVEAIGALSRRHGLWLHVDAAHSGAACICPEFRWMLAGIDAADSLCFNPHKWMLTNFDCDLLWTSDRASLTAALSITPEYLRNKATESGASAAIDFRDWQVPLGRRFRALKLWFVIRSYGVEGLRAFIREHVRLAAEFERWVRADERFEVAAPRTINLVCFRLKGEGEQADARNRALLEAVNSTGRAYLTHTVLPGVGYVLRMCIGGVQTREAHVRAAWDLLGEVAKRV